MNTLIVLLLSLLPYVNPFVGGGSHKLYKGPFTVKEPCELIARYVKVYARNIGTIPAWHPGAGAPGFIFIDELWAR